MFNTPNIVGLIKAAAGTSDNNVPVYQAPPGGPLHERVFDAQRKGDTETVRSLVPHVFRDRGASSDRQAAAGKSDDSSETLAYQPPPGGALHERVFGAMRRGDIATARALVPHVFEGRSGGTSSGRVRRPAPKPEPKPAPAAAAPAAQMSADLDEHGMPISLDSPEAMAESDALLKKIQADNAAPATPANPATPAKPAAPASPATPNPYAFRNITADDMRKWRRYTGASDMNSEMDKWKTWQAIMGNRNASNADFYKARSRGFR